MQTKNSTVLTRGRLRFRFVRKFFERAVFVLFFCVGASPAATIFLLAQEDKTSQQSTALETTDVSPVVSLLDRRELFLDDYLIESAKNAEILVHQPVRKNVVAVFDAPWEGSGCNYFTVLRDEKEGVYRMYFHAWSIPDGVDPGNTLRIGYWESRDGINWTRPNLGLYEVDGSKENNIVLAQMGDGSNCHDFSPFIDANPDATPDARYKATGASWNADRGVWAYRSPDGIHWTPMNDGPVFSQGQFDSQNVAFWSPTEKKYVLYYRIFSEGAAYKGVRLVARAVSDDFIHWTAEGPIQFPDGEGPKMEAQFYVNQILPYYRAPHLSIGFPTRYVDNGLTVSTPLLPEWERRRERMNLGERLGTAVTDAVYISSRDGVHFRQSPDVFLAPGLRTKDNWTYGDNYIARHVVETAAEDDDSPNELSLFATESYFTNKTSQLRRYTLRIDGFGSLHAKSNGGEATTKPFVFSGDELSLNAATSGAGTIRVEILDENGTPIPNRSLDDCDLIYGDSLDRRVSWKNGEKSVADFAGKTIRLRFVLREADVYSLKFEPASK